MCLLWPTFNNKYASGVSADVNGIAAHTGPESLQLLESGVRVPISRRRSASFTAALRAKS